jgi:hypothetical protein
MLRALSPVGCIEDLALNIKWHAPAFAQLAAGRAAVQPTEQKAEVVTDGIRQQRLELVN